MTTFLSREICKGSLVEVYQINKCLLSRNWSWYQSFLNLQKFQCQESMTLYKLIRFAEFSISRFWCAIRRLIVLSTRSKFKTLICGQNFKKKCRVWSMVSLNFSLYFELSLLFKMSCMEDSHTSAGSRIHKKVLRSSTRVQWSIHRFRYFNNSENPNSMRSLFWHFAIDEPPLESTLRSLEIISHSLAIKSQWEKKSECNFVYPDHSPSPSNIFSETAFWAWRYAWDNFISTRIFFNQFNWRSYFTSVASSAISSSLLARASVEELE